MNIVVIGDVLLDQDLDGPSTRLSPDGHAPVVDVARSTVRPGGAGLVARLLASAGHGTTLVTVLSDDGASRSLRRCLRGVEVVAGPSGAPTPVKTRVLKDGCAVVRVDEGCGTAPVPSATPQMVAALDGADAVVVADYGRGLLANSMIRVAIARCAERLPVVWDPHPRGADPVPGIRVTTPNLAEALGFAGLPPDSDSSAAGQAAERLRKMWQADAVAVTAGADGAWLHDGRSTGGTTYPHPPWATSTPAGPVTASPPAWPSRSPQVVMPIWWTPSPPRSPGRPTSSGTAAWVP
nr:PfkB family carbohydrate kinase [Raineyella fluvialis]